MSDPIEPYTYYTIQDPDNNYLSCDTNGNITLNPTEDTSAGPNTQWWYTGENAPGQTILTNQVGGGSYYLYSDDVDNDDLMTGGVTTWTIDPDGSFLANQSNPLYAGSNTGAMKAVGTKTKQTWTWNKKSLKGSSNY